MTLSPPSPPDQSDGTPPIALPTATIKRRVEDFVVEELPAYPASGEGEHAFVTLRKTGLTTAAAVDRIAAALDVDARGAGHAGMKDRHAITTQTISVPFPLRRSIEEIERIAVEGVEILGVARHGNKLKPGHLRGNRFTLFLRDVTPEGAPAITAGLTRLAETGVPNAFGAQRFGRDGNNPERALAWLSGADRGPPRKQDQRFLFSALQSLLFNRVLDRRLAEGTAFAVLPGDVAKKHDSGALFDVPLEGPERDDAVARGDRNEVSPTGPMYGIKMRWPTGRPLELEQEVLAEAGVTEARLGELRALGEGTRRALRIHLTELSVGSLQPDGLAISFVLPKGGYATTALTCTCRLVDASS